MLDGPGVWSKESEVVFNQAKWWPARRSGGSARPWWSPTAGWPSAPTNHPTRCLRPLRKRRRSQDNIKSYKQVSERSLFLLSGPILKSMYPSPPLMIRYVLGSDAAVSEDSDAGSSEPESALPGGGIAWPGAKTRSHKRIGNILLRSGDLCRLAG